MNDGVMSDGDWYFCLVHQRTEHGHDCPNAERMGPYASQKEADRALRTAAERNESWDKDPHWQDD